MRSTGWRFSTGGRVGLCIAFCAILAFGALLERRTALRRQPMTDLGVFSCAAWAAWHGDDIYTMEEWHGWHYVYPPPLAIVFAPFALPPPTPPVAAAGKQFTPANTPWGYPVSGANYFGLGGQNLHFFWIVAAWYLLSVVMTLLSVHLLACALEGRAWRAAPPSDARARTRWWALRILPLLACGASLGTDLSRGQVDVLMLFAACAGLYLAANGKDMAAGFSLSLPAAIKLFPVLLLIHPVLRRRWWMIAGVTAGLFLTLVILPVVVLGPARTESDYAEWVKVIGGPALGHGADTSHQRELTGMNGTDNQSLLAAIHNWKYFKLPHNQRPAQAAPWERRTAYVIGGLMLAGIVATSGFRRQESPRELLAIAGILMGLALVINPVAHNYYYLLLLPLIAALIDAGLPWLERRAPDWKLLAPVIVFTATDMAVRLPGIGPLLRDLGVPLLSLVFLMWAGLSLLNRHGIGISASWGERMGAFRAWRLDRATPWYKISA